MVIAADSEPTCPRPWIPTSIRSQCAGLTWNSCVGTSEAKPSGANYTEQYKRSDARGRRRERERELFAEDSCRDCGKHFYIIIYKGEAFSHAAITARILFVQKYNNNNNNNGNVYSAGIRHVVALLHHCVHQTHIKHYAKTILLIKQHFRFKIYKS